MSPADSYLTTFRELREEFSRKMDDKLVNKKSSSALRAAMATHAMNQAPRPNGRLLVTDNFYTRHFLAEQIQNLSDGESLCLGTDKNESEQTNLYSRSQGNWTPRKGACCCMVHMPSLS